MSEQPDSVNCFIISLQEQNLLLPQSVAVEVVTQQVVRAVPGAPGWLRGVFDWRQAQVPIVSLDTLLQVPEERQTRINRFVVLHGVERHAGLDYYGLQVRGIPHPVKLSPTDIELEPRREEDPPVIAARVRASGVLCIIPAFEMMEDMLQAGLQGL
ncbi:MULTISPECIES: chemotaxis protein CheW [unclassified Ectothiorhodospira]|uniref:chemotaxis protein CheW n=1 Tax=unclassified Ectothiorhodospira TaxID=2684909 RepID=UPI001EE8EE2B|nr:MULTISPECIES: chemotaxis protein CheW [unclassified Ectothiorhodospira]MCG5514752.1 chemotaxis protein CheW [Ectothiorhodospira sp. 9100]MCG5518351.1 chemotaxis protein CheW [Ectothiorhodospira sp. 9905]